ncbi:MAG: hypothetical protein JOY95_12465 [Silvibacterium sp.]|nr:hypothetical protein [Silvibacterium sp.]
MRPRLLAVAFLFVPLAAMAQRDVPVPAQCTPSVNQKLFDLLGAGGRGNVDNVMVCGVTRSHSYTQHGGPHGDHEILPLLVKMPNGSSQQVEVVINDELDGVVTAPADASVFAFGQAFFPSHGRYVAGIHDVHCSTHRGADNGWVVVNGVKHPPSCSRSY